MARAITKGDKHELRVARLLFAEGFFVRRAIDLNMKFGEELTVTDLDVLALRFNPDLSVSVSIGEVKTAQGRKGPKLADRLLWLRGVQSLVQADAAFVATLKGSSPRVRGLGESLRIAVIDERDLTYREEAAGLSEDSSWGSCDPRLLTRQREIYDIAKSDKNLKRIYWFIRSEFWLLDNVIGVKRALGALSILGGEWDPGQAEDRRKAIKWLASQLQVNIVVGFVRLASRSYSEEPARSSEWLLKELASGPGLNYETIRKISDQVDRYITTVLRDLDADPGKQAGALGAFSPQPPPYAESLLEVIQRLALEPEAAAELPRFVDNRAAAADLQEELGGVRMRSDLAPACERLSRLIGAFIAGRLKVPPELLRGTLPIGNNGVIDGSPGASQSGTSGKEETSTAEAVSTLFDEPGNH